MIWNQITIMVKVFLPFYSVVDNNTDAKVDFLKTIKWVYHDLNLKLQDFNFIFLPSQSNVQLNLKLLNLNFIIFLKQ